MHAHSRAHKHTQPRPVLKTWNPSCSCGGGSRRAYSLFCQLPRSTPSKTNGGVGMTYLGARARERARVRVRVRVHVGVSACVGVSVSFPVSVSASFCPCARRCIAAAQNTYHIQCDCFDPALISASALAKTDFCFAIKRARRLKASPIDAPRPLPAARRFWPVFLPGAASRCLRFPAGAAVSAGQRGKSGRRRYEFSTQKVRMHARTQGPAVDQARVALQMLCAGPQHRASFCRVRGTVTRT